MVEVVNTVKLPERFNLIKCVTSLIGFTAQPTLISSTSKWSNLLNRLRGSMSLIGLHNQTSEKS